LHGTNKKGDLEVALSSQLNCRITPISVLFRSLFRDLAANLILESIRRPNRHRAARASRVYAAAISRLCNSLSIKSFPAIFEVATLVIKADIMYFATPG
jgi:hypothetical protein